MKIQNDLKLIAGLFFVIISVYSCGVSDEVRYASANLVEKQNQTLEAHIKFHSTILNTLNNYLDLEKARSEALYTKTIEENDQGLIEALREIYSDSTKSVTDKKVKEEEARIETADNKKTAEKNRFNTASIIAKSKESLQNASQAILETEKAKSTVITEVNAYLQEKRISEQILNYANISLNDKQPKMSNFLGALEKTFINNETITNQNQEP